MEVSVSFLCNIDPKITISTLNNSNADYIHFDIMDGKFVKNKFLDIASLKEYLKLSTKKNDLHLMCKRPLKYFKQIKNYPITYFTIHYEIPFLKQTIKYLKKNNVKIGLAINPDTDIKKVFPLLKDLDLVLIMSVYPGASGQKFIEDSKTKVNELKEEIKKQKLITKISVDGGINDTNYHKLKNADILTSSSFVLKNLNNINLLKNN